MPDYEAKAKAEREEIIADTRRKVKETIDQQQRNMEREMFGR